VTAGGAGGEVTRFRGLLTRRFGLAFDDGKTELLHELLHRRLAATGNAVEAYLLALEQADAGELAALAPEVTVGETYFFRHGDQLRAFAERVLPERRRRRGAGERLRVLSAGCASGEEPYSLAMVLREGGGAGGEPEIVGVDVNQRALARSAAGVYGAWSLRDTPPPVRRRWFRARGETFVLDDDIRRSVRLGPGNLVADGEALWAPERYDVVFCRNVLMYFAPAAARAVLARLARALAPGGFLFLGHAENLRGLSVDFDLCQTHDTFYYQRRERLADAVLTGDAAGASWNALRWVESIQQASDRIERLCEPFRTGAATGSGGAEPVEGSGTWRR
jgi:chemotaxis protein methyltransferase CheR